MDLNFFISPVFYLILGYYLSKKEFNVTANKVVLVSLVVFIISTILKMKFGNAFDVYPKNNLSTTLDLSFLQILQARAIF